VPAPSKPEKRRPAELEKIDVEYIDVLPSHRKPDPKAVERLAASIKEIGLRTPITVRYFPDRPGEAGTCDSHVLVAGGHRLAAVKSLGWEKIECVVVDEDDRQARLWEIAENLHRKDLTRLERSEQIAEWIKITDGVSGQFGQKLTEGVSGQIDQKPIGPKKGGRPEGGVALAARQLPLDGDTDEARRHSARRAIKIASLSDEAKEVAKETGLDNNSSALLEAASEPTPERQVEKLSGRAAERKPPLTPFELIVKLLPKLSVSERDELCAMLNGGAT
jgi:ParB family chromosome partitioning protein